MIWNLWQYILLILWTIESLRNQIKLLSLRTQYLYMRIDTQCTRLNPCFVYEMFHLFSCCQIKCFNCQANFYQNPQRSFVLCPQRHLSEEWGLFLFFYDTTDFVIQRTWQKRDIDSFPWRTRRTEAALTCCGFLLLPGTAASGSVRGPEQSFADLGRKKLGTSLSRSKPTSTSLTFCKKRFLVDAYF